MTAPLENQAIQAALAQSWEKAVELNEEILKLQPRNIATLNRLGRAYQELGKVTEARKTYKKVLRLERYNPIALKNLVRLPAGQARLTSQKSSKKKLQSSTKILPKEIFLEEPGKTKVVKLVRLASAQVLAGLDNADSVILLPRKRIVSILTQDGTYLGALPDDLSRRLVNFIKGGNRYQAFVKSVDCRHLEIFIREVFRSQKFRHIPSFTVQSLPEFFSQD